MVEPEKPEKDPLSDKKKQNENLRKFFEVFLDRRIQVMTAALMLIGIILSFFYIHIGSLLVGLAVGIAFFQEIYKYFLELRDLYSEQGLFKTLMLIGIILYFLIVVPAFIIATAIGFGAIYLIRLSVKK